MQQVQAQQVSTAFIMSSVGSIQNMSNNSMAVTLNSTASCLKVQNGTALLASETGTGSFSQSCEVNIKYNTLGIKMFPNPVTSTAKVKFIIAPIFSDQFSISIWSTEGYRVSSSKANGYDLFQGKLIDFTALNAGSFIIQIESDKFMDAIKFIKSN
jgi:hypothetical protein